MEARLNAARERIWFNEAARLPASPQRSLFGESH